MLRKLTPGSANHKPVWLLLAAIIGVLMTTSLPHTSLFANAPGQLASTHLLMELIAIIISSLVITIAIHSIHKDNYNFANTLIVGFTMIVAMDLCHSFTFQGMPPILGESSAELAIYFWLMGRILEVVTILMIAARIPLKGGPS